MCAWYHLGPRKHERRSNLMTAIKRACSCIRVLMTITCREERERERENIVKYPSRA